MMLEDRCVITVCFLLPSILVQIRLVRKKTFKKFCVIVIVAIFLGDGCGVNYIITGIMHMNALHFSEKKTYSVLDGSVL